MNWLELLLVIVFFGAPLLGRILQRNAPPQPPTVPPADAEREDIRWVPAPAPQRESLPAPAKDGGWSAGWGEWSGLEADTDEDAAELAGEDIAGDHDLGADSIHTREAISLEPVTLEEATVRPLPVTVSLEATQVDRSAEHQRFHQKYFKAPPPRPRSDRLADHLRSRREVRRAVLLAEVLGPPRALRELDSDR